MAMRTGAHATWSPPTSGATVADGAPDALDFCFAPFRAFATGAALTIATSSELVSAPDIAYRISEGTARPEPNVAAGILVAVLAAHAVPLGVCVCVCCCVDDGSRPPTPHHATVGPGTLADKMGPILYIVPSVTLVGYQETLPG